MGNKSHPSEGLLQMQSQGTLGPVNALTQSNQPDHALNCQVMGHWKSDCPSLRGSPTPPRRGTLNR